MPELAPLTASSYPATEESYIGGAKPAGTMTWVNLMMADGTDEFSWDAPVGLWTGSHLMTRKARVGCARRCRQGRPVILSVRPLVVVFLAMRRQVMNSPGGACADPPAGRSGRFAAPSVAGCPRRSAAD